jgi:hypothetical protein
MLSDLAILTEEAAKVGEFSTETVRTFLATWVTTREARSLTKAEVSNEEAHFIGEKPNTGPRGRRNSSPKRCAKCISENFRTSSYRGQTKEMSLERSCRRRRREI